jgi:predicted 3-demethylubiquinone-9 3-methyltransferase (glyoxalase superfamily)
MLRKLRTIDGTPEGSVKRASYTLAGEELIRIDSPVRHRFPFTRSFSLFVGCKSESELYEAFRRL